MEKEQITWPSWWNGGTDRRRHRQEVERPRLADDLRPRPQGRDPVQEQARRRARQGRRHAARRDGVPDESRKTRKSAARRSPECSGFDRRVPLTLNHLADGGRLRTRRAATASAHASSSSTTSAFRPICSPTSSRAQGFDTRAAYSPQDALGGGEEVPPRRRDLRLPDAGRDGPRPASSRSRACGARRSSSS